MISIVMLYNRLQLIRTERGMSREELARRIDVNVQTIGFIERGNYSPSLELAFKIARVFEVPLESIFSDQIFPSLFPTKEKS